MGKNARRLCVLGFALAASAALAALAFPGSASADQTLSGDCATTLQGAGSQGLILDLGAPINAPGKLTVGLDSQGAGLLSLHAGDTVRTLGVGDLPAVNGVCAAVQDMVNRVGDTTQGLLGGKPATPSPPHEPGKPDPRPTDPQAPLAPNPGNQTCAVCHTAIGSTLTSYATLAGVAVLHTGITTGCAQSSLIFWPMRRATMSAGPPAGNGTISRIARLGKLAAASCARAGAGAAREMRAARSSAHTFMVLQNALVVG